jgi:hypothetical protein
MDNLEETSQAEIDAHLIKLWRNRGPLYAMSSISVMLDHRPDFAKLHRRGASISVVPILQAIYQAVGTLLADFSDRPAVPPFPDSWAPDDTAFRCGLDLSTPSLTDHDRVRARSAISALEPAEVSSLGVTRRAQAGNSPRFGCNARYGGPTSTDGWHIPCCSQNTTSSRGSCSRPISRSWLRTRGWESSPARLWPVGS